MTTHGGYTTDSRGLTSMSSGSSPLRISCVLSLFGTLCGALLVASHGKLGDDINVLVPLAFQYKSS